MLEQSSRLHHQLIKFASQYSQWADVRHLGVMCWMIVGLIGEGSVNLTKWIDHIQTKAQIAQSTQKLIVFFRVLNAHIFSPVVPLRLLIPFWILDFGLGKRFQYGSNNHCLDVCW